MSLYLYVCVLRRVQLVALGLIGEGTVCILYFVFCICIVQLEVLGLIGEGTFAPRGVSTTKH